MNKFFISLLLSFFFVVSYGQNDLGTKFFFLGDFQNAEKVFNASVNQNADYSNYYLGEIALKSGNKEKALEYYNKGIAADNNAVFCVIGKTKLESDSSKELAKALTSIQKKNKKNADVVFEVAHAFLDKGLYNEANSTLSVLRSIEKDSPRASMLGGDILLKQDKPGEAAGFYEQSFTQSPSFTLGYIKYSDLYFNKPTIVTNTLRQGLEANPGDILLDRAIGFAYYRFGFYDRAVTAYKNFFKSGYQNATDLGSYAACLYFSENYDEALDAINSVLANDPNHRVMNRFLMYTYNKIGKYDEAIDVAQKLFSLTTDGTPLPSDYVVYGDILVEKEELEKATEQYLKAYEIDKNQPDVLKEGAIKMVKARHFQEGGELYQKYIDLSDSKSPSDFLNMGMAYYRQAIELNKLADGEKTPELVAQFDFNATKAISAFTSLIDLVGEPQNYLGYYWRGNVKSVIDSDLSKGLANDDYAKMIDLIVTNDLNEPKKLVEGYRYFAIYYIYQFDTTKKATEGAKAKEYASKVLEIDPTDATTLQIMDALKAM